MIKNNTHILVVDDDDRIRELIKKYLQDNSFIVSTSPDAEKAKIKLNQFIFDIIAFQVFSVVNGQCKKDSVTTSITHLSISGGGAY